MKKTTLLKIIGFILLFIVILFIFLGLNLTGQRDAFGNLDIKPGFFLAAIILLFPTSILLFSGFAPQIAKLSSQVRSETIDHAGEDIKEATSKTSKTIIPAITPAIKESIHEIKKDKELRLNEAKELLNKNLITKEEYEMMRKNILGL